MKKTLLIAFLPALANGFGYMNGDEPMLLIGNTGSSTIVKYSQTDGSFMGEFIGSEMLDRPDQIILYEDSLYISTGTTVENSAILKFDKDDGSFIETYAEGGGMLRPYGFAFGGDRTLYVASFGSDQILTYPGGEVFAEGDGSEGSLVQGPNDMIFGMDGKLYLTTQGSVAVNGSATYPGLPSQVVCFDVATGEGSVFIEQPEPSSFGFVSLLGIKQDATSGNFYVSDFANNIRVYTSAGELVTTLDTNISGNQWVGNIAFGMDGYLFSVVHDYQDDANPGAILRWDTDLEEAPLVEGTEKPIFVDYNNDLVRPIGILAL